jgi:chloride channel protein, CIC family
MMKWRSYINFLRFTLKVQKKSGEIIHQHEVPLEWLRTKLTHNQFLTLAGILVGLTTGFAAVVLKIVVHYIHNLITQDYHLPYQLLFYLIFPALGIILTVLVVKYLLRGKDGKGIGNVLYEMAQKSSLVAPYKMYSQMIASAITVGLGGSAGLEAPIAVTGAAIGSNFARTYRLNYKDRTLLLAAGSAAGIATAFNAPIAGVMFSVEIILSGVVFSDFIPLIIAAVCGSLLSKIILNEAILLHFNLKQEFDYRNVPFYILLGGVCGIYSRYYAVYAKKVEHFFHKFGESYFRKGLVGAAGLAVCCFVLPPLFGDGYGYIKTLANQGAGSLIQNSLFASLTNPWIVLAFVGFVCMVKVFATSITIASGGSGGNFAPALFAGAFLGYFFSQLIVLLHIYNLPVANFAIVGMAGVMSGVMYAPLTSIFLIAEVTGGYDLFIPLMIVSTSAYLIAKRFSPYSMETEDFVEKGQIFTRQHDRNILSMLHIQDMLEKNILTISPDALLKDLVALIKVSKRNLFAVVDTNNELSGIITMDDVKELMFKTDLYNNIIIRQVMKTPPAFIEVNEDMQSIMKKFEQTQSWNLPVLKGKKYLGFISKSTLLNEYREVLRDYSIEES